MTVIRIVECPKCEGRGEIPKKMMKDAQVYVYDDPCPRCKGKKKIGVKDKT